MQSLLYSVIKFQRYTMGKYCDDVVKMAQCISLYRKAMLDWQDSDLPEVIEGKILELRRKIEGIDPIALQGENWWSMIFDQLENDC
jgi:hypothetical protein